MIKKLILSAIIYLSIVIAFAILFSKNVVAFVHIKGDEFFYTMYFLVGLTYVFCTYWYFGVFKKSLLFFILFPVVNVLVSVIGGFIIFFDMFSIDGTSTQIIYILSLIYSSIAILGLLILFNRISKNKPPITLSRKTIFDRTLRNY
jgi:hypothetical protein